MWGLLYFIIKNLFFHRFHIMKKKKRHTDSITNIGGNIQHLSFDFVDLGKEQNLLQSLY